MATQKPPRFMYESQTKFKGFIMLQRIKLCKLQPKQAYALALMASSRWLSHTKMEENKEMFATNKKYTHYKRLACRVALEYGLKDSPCSTEWTDVRYKCIRD